MPDLAIMFKHQALLLAGRNFILGAKPNRMHVLRTAASFMKADDTLTCVNIYPIVEESSNTGLCFLV